MSYDLYFYTRNGREIDPKDIEEYLLKNGCTRDGEFPQWIFENEATNVYFMFERQPESDDPEDIEIFESFAEFDNTQFTFSLNFLRPNFFGLEAFAYVERLMDELDLYALNPQSHSDPDTPSRETSEKYYSEWSKANLDFSSEHFDSLDLLYFPLDISNAYWNYNFNAARLQESLGDEYYVPTMFLVRRASTGLPITMSTWTQHIPNLFPPADYFLINRKRRKLFRTIDESGLISRETFMRVFGSYLEPFDFKDCFIIHPEKTELVADVFNTVEFEAVLEGFLGDGIDLSTLTNAERSPIQKSID